jgi:MYXO-CTERM domain-containing protein
MNMAYPGRPQRHLATLTFLAAFAATLLGASTASARIGGIDTAQFQVDGIGCNVCHSNHGVAVPPGVQLMASTTSLTAGQQITLTFVVTSMGATQTAAGFNISSTQPGAFAAGNTGTRTTGLNMTAGTVEATHSAPKANDAANQATFMVLWTPNAGVSGTVTFKAWGNSVNQMGTNVGDYAARTTLDVTVAPGCTPTPWYRDADGDTYGDSNPDTSTSACTQPVGYVANNTDCNDDSVQGGAIHPGATEACNGIDDNCDLTADNGLAMMPFYYDGDRDGYGATPTMACSLAAAGLGYVTMGGDCDDTRPLIHPGATETCNAMDDDCDLLTDEELGTITCGVSPCAVMLPACVGGSVQQCPPGAGVCPVDAGSDAGSNDTVDAGSAIDTGSSVDARDPSDATRAEAGTMADAAARDAVSQPGADVAVVDAPLGDARAETGPPADTGTINDVGSVAPVDARNDARRTDAQVDAAGSAPPGADADTGGDTTDSGCSCRTANRSGGRGEAIFGAALLALSWARRRRRSAGRADSC